MIRWKWACTLLLCATAGLSSSAAAGEAAVLSLVTAQAASPAEVTATGRVLPVLLARIGARLNGRIVSWAQADGGLLDVGMPVKKDQELFRIDTTTFQARVEIARAAVQRAEAALADLKAGVRAEQRQALRAALGEIAARIEERKRDEERFRRLVQEDKTMPVKRLEEVQLALAVLEQQRQAAQARVAEADAGPTPTQIAVAEALVSEAKAQLAAAELDLRDTVVTAPFTGIIIHRFKSLGDYLTSAPFTEVLELSGTDLEAELNLPETYFHKIIPDRTRVSVQSPLLPNGLTLPVHRIIPAVDPRSGSFAFRVRIPSGERGQLVGGVFVQGKVPLDDATLAVIVPQRALVREEGKAFVFVAQDGKMSRQAVVPGDELTEGIIIKSGLKPGARVVLGPAAQLKDGADLPEYLGN
jgi:multidrug efflux pump subunit AcrA (membrane-fusion protein)